ncbi:MAG: hypothetical protein ABL907_06585 [Hyphomicrobium sp.]
MYDFDLHMRFLKSATEAWFSYASASAAAVGVMNDRIHDTAAPVSKAQPLNPFDPFSWWTSALAATTVAPVRQPPVNPFDPFGLFSTALNGVSPTTPAFPNPFAAFNPFQFASFASNPFVPAGLGHLASMSPADFQQNIALANGWTNILQAWSWAMPPAASGFYQMPMTAWLMSAGLPYSVAAPTAKANAASMDAAEAAREGFDRVMSHFNTKDGPAAAPVSMLPNMMMMFVTPWLPGQTPAATDTRTV